MSRIVYIDKTSLVDWDGKVVATIFMCGCNFRCWYCHNKDIIFCNGSGLDLKQVIGFLKRRRDWLDGVVITGGEPLMDKDILSVVRAIKRIGYEIKIDTNGSRPDILKSLIEQQLIDYVAMDVKWYFDRYEEVVGVRIGKEKLMESVEILRNAKIDSEFRTTVFKGMRKSDIVRIAEQVAPARKYVLQAQLENGRVNEYVEKSLLEAYDELKNRNLFRVLKIRNIKRG